MQEIFTKWKNTSSTFTKLQWVYALSAVTLLLLGGLVSLIDYTSGYAVATVSIYLAAIFLVNFVTSSVIASLLGSKPARTTKR